MKNKAIILFLILLSANVASFRIGYKYSGKWVHADKIETIRVNVIEEKDLRAYVSIELYIDKNFSEKNNNLTIYFLPRERLSHPPAENVRVKSCFGTIKSSYFEGIDILCTEEIPTVKTTDDGEYSFILEIPKSRQSSVVVNVSYTIPNFILEQGEYDVIWFTHTNLKGNLLSNSVLLPKSTSIPYRFPQDAKIDRYKDRWAFALNGNKNQFIWYTDAEESELRSRNNLIYGAILGAIFSGIIGIITALIFRPKLEDYLNKRKVLKNEVYPALHIEIKEKLETISKFDGGLGTKRCSELHEERDKLVDSGKYDMIPTKKYFIFLNTLKTKIDEFYKGCEGFDDTLSKAARSVYDILKREFENRGISGVSESEISLVIFYERFLRKEMEKPEPPNDKRGVAFMSRRTIPELKLANSDLTDKSFTYDELLEDIHNKVKESELYVQFREKFEAMKKYEELLNELKS